MNPHHSFKCRNLNRIGTYRTLLFAFSLNFINYFCLCSLYFDWLFYFTYFTFVLQTVEFTMLLLIRSFGNTFGLKCMHLLFQMNIHKDIS